MYEFGVLCRFPVGPDVIGHEPTEPTHPYTNTFAKTRLTYVKSRDSLVFVARSHFYRLLLSSTSLSPTTIPTNEARNPQKSIRSIRTNDACAVPACIPYRYHCVPPSLIPSKLVGATNDTLHSLNSNVSLCVNVQMS